MNNAAGKLIVIEGLDGAGTTTQTRLLERWLVTYCHLDAMTTREPSNGPIGAMIRAILAKRLSSDPLTLAGLFATDRLDHIFRPGGIYDQLKTGKWILMDRYYLSSFAYQASTMNEEQIQWLRAIHAPCPRPDLTVFIDVPVDICLERISQNRYAEFELFEKKAALEEIRTQYFVAMEYFQSQGEIFVIIDGTQPIETVQHELQTAINQAFHLV
jgi:dTMP kinase